MASESKGTAGRDAGDGPGPLDSHQPSPVFVIGSDPFNALCMDELAQADHFEVARGPGLEELLELDLDFEGQLALCREQAPTPEDVGAVVGYWDFPITALQPLMAQELAVPGPTPLAVANCEHKFWSRRIQRQAIPELTPEFQAVDPFDDEAIEAIDLEYPYWIKPVKGSGSYLAFRIRKAADLKAAIPRIREGIDDYAIPFAQFLAHLDEPPEDPRASARLCLAEEEVRGRQCTVEGWVSRGRVDFHGVVDSIRERNRSSFQRYQYPSKMPRRIKQRMFDALRRLIPALGYDDAPFNVEFFWERSRDALHILEVNPRVSQSHATLFQYVDGRPNFQVTCDVARGKCPRMPHRAGDYRVAAKYYLRHFRDGVVTRVPTEAEIEELQARYPSLHLRVDVQEGDRLSELTAKQDSYSFILGILFLGAESSPVLQAKYQDLRERLALEVDDS